MLEFIYTVLLPILIFVFFFELCRTRWGFIKVCLGIITIGVCLWILIICGFISLSFVFV